jgi:pyruvate formate lyase activating enzyme
VGENLSLDRREFVGICGKGCLMAGLMPPLGGLIDGLGRASVQTVGDVSNVVGRFWHPTTGQNTVCQLCPRKCEIAPGERGFCGVRENVDGQYVSKVYGKPVAVKADYMEKGPFYHFLPRTRTLALGTAGCNLDCKYCQSWQFAQARPEQTDNKNLPPDSLVTQVKDIGLKSITFTYSEPIQCIEYVLDTAALAHKAGLKVLIHTAGYCCPETMQAFTKAVDAINIDLKGFTADFYQDVTGGRLETVLDSIKVAAASGVWLELTNLVVPGYNDNPDTFSEMCRWIVANCGPDVPLHVSRFFPTYKLGNVPSTPADTLTALRGNAYQAGLRYVYVGNMNGHPAESTYCPKCGYKVIRRVNYDVENTGLDLGNFTCVKCHTKIPGIWT